MTARLGLEDQAGRVAIGIETDRGLCVLALSSAGYRIFAINPLQVACYRELQSVSRAKSDAADAHVLADIVVPTLTNYVRSPVIAMRVVAVKIMARAHKTLIWELTRHAHRSRNAPRESLPAALLAFGDLTAATHSNCWPRRPTRHCGPADIAQISAALKRTHRHHAGQRAPLIQAALRSE